MSTPFTFDDFNRYYSDLTLGMDIALRTRDGSFAIKGCAKLKGFADFKTDTVTVHLTDFVTDPIGLNAKKGWVFYYESVPAASIEIHNQYLPLLQFGVQELQADHEWKTRFKAYLDQTSGRLAGLLGQCQMANEKNVMVPLSSFASFQISNMHYIG
ncbi:hypothetical protein [Paenibacillus flagellatus]|uniref:Uncharacterized protein n=1 Tax=Paenibacillus flagellatus TaxID=2211139 RepID=A0A2V5JW86_9BACL|nr:hypothetical protein [Paenibacillus flagellatus]PYI51019.1 hypothetical protein DLM86_27015 [Paenibacillus flagellatus]